LLKSGNYKLPDGSFLAAIIHNYLDVNEFISPLYKRIFEEYWAELSKGEAPSVTYFLAHPEEEVRKLSVDLLADNHTLSPNWLEMYQTKVEHPDSMPEVTAPKWIMRYQERYIQVKADELREQLKQTTDGDEQKEILGQIMELKRFEIDLATRLGAAPIRR
jgi:DNA primase